MWQDAVVVRRHQRQLLFMQLQCFAERHAAKLVRTGAAFLAGTLSGTSANNTRKGIPPDTLNGSCCKKLFVSALYAAKLTCHCAGLSAAKYTCICICAVMLCVASTCGEVRV